MATLVGQLLPTSNAQYFYLPAAYVLYLVAAVSRRKAALTALGILLEPSGLVRYHADAKETR